MRENMQELLGKTVKHKISGLEGVVIGVAIYVFEAPSLYVVPKDPSKEKEWGAWGEWDVVE